MHYYNEFDPKAVQWLKRLMDQGLIGKGDIDDRSITDVRPDDLKGYAQCHFFAGIGGWSRALRLAGWDDARPVWTGSCPCQPYSTIGLGKGQEDHRNLWPVWFNLIQECRPDIIYGEQVDEAIGKQWLCTVGRDLESADYAVAAFVLSAFTTGAPHERYRLWFTANSEMQPRFHQSIYHKKEQEEERLYNNETYWLSHPWDKAEPTVYRLDDGLSSFVAEWHGFGNAIEPNTAAEFIKASM